MALSVSLLASEKIADLHVSKLYNFPYLDFCGKKKHSIDDTGYDVVLSNGRLCLLSDGTVPFEMEKHVIEKTYEDYTQRITMISEILPKGYDINANIMCSIIESGDISDFLDKHNSHKSRLDPVSMYLERKSLEEVLSRRNHNAYYINPRYSALHGNLRFLNQDSSFSRKVSLEEYRGDIIMLEKKSLLYAKQTV